eukprot:10213897-Prorocentrum_lima.AAC.1
MADLAAMRELAFQRADKVPLDIPLRPRSQKEPAMVKWKLWWITVPRWLPPALAQLSRPSCFLL